MENKQYRQNTKQVSAHRAVKLLSLQLDLQRLKGRKDMFTEIPNVGDNVIDFTTALKAIERIREYSAEYYARDLYNVDK